MSGFDTTSLPGLEMGTESGADHDVGQKKVSDFVTGFISTAGLICNAIVIVVICLLKDYKKTTHWYVLNLAIADSMFLAMLLLSLVENLWGKSFAICVMFQGSFYVNYYAGVLFLAVMSFDRYIAIAHPISKSCRRIRSRCGSYGISMAVWIGAAAASLPLMAKTTLSQDGRCDFSFEYIDPICLENNITTLSQCEIWQKAEERKASDIHPQDTENLEAYFYDLIDDGFEDLYDGMDVVSETAIPNDFTLPEDRELSRYFTCIHSDNPSYIAWIYSHFVLSFVLPLFIMAVCYGGILWRVQHPRVKSSNFSFIVGKKGKSSSASKSGAKMNKKVRITILVVSLVVVFVICWLPFYVFVLAKVDGISLTSKACEKFHIIVLLIAYSNSLWNPIMYTFLGINFLKRLRTVKYRLFGRSRTTRNGSYKWGRSNRSGSASFTKQTKACSVSEPALGSPMDIPLQSFGITETKGEKAEICPIPVVKK